MTGRRRLAGRVSINESQQHHQEHQAREEVRDAVVSVLLALPGTGKTFFAIQRMAQVLNSDPRAVLLFVARNTALAFFACSGLSPHSIVERVHMLVDPFLEGPCEQTLGGQRRRRRGASSHGRLSAALDICISPLAGDGGLPDPGGACAIKLPRGQAVGRDALRIEAYRRGRLRVPTRGDTRDDVDQRARTSSRGSSTWCRRQLADLEDLNDRIAVVGPDEAFAPNR